MRAHKLALQAQRQFWHCLLRDSVSFKDLQDGLDNMAKAERQATAVYRRCAHNPHVRHAAYSGLPCDTCCRHWLTCFTCRAAANAGSWSGKDARLPAGCSSDARACACLSMQGFVCRYPTNGKLLKIYGRFLEYVRHDPWGVTRTLQPGRCRPPA